MHVHVCACTHRHNINMVRGTTNFSNEFCGFSTRAVTDTCVVMLGFLHVSAQKNPVIGPHGFVRFATNLNVACKPKPA